MTMTTLFSILSGWAVLGLFEIAPASAAEPLDELEGRWSVISMETDGVEGPKEIVENTRLTFMGKKLILTTMIGPLASGGRPEDYKKTTPLKLECTFEINPDKTPKQIDIMSPRGDGETMPGIYSIDGDKLTLCIRTSKALGRPEKFETAADSGSTLSVLTRVKE